MLEVFCLCLFPCVALFHCLWTSGMSLTQVAIHLAAEPVISWKTITQWRLYWKNCLACVCCIGRSVLHLKLICFNELHFKLAKFLRTSCNNEECWVIFALMSCPGEWKLKQLLSFHVIFRGIIEVSCRTSEGCSGKQFSFSNCALQPGDFQSHK